MESPNTNHRKVGKRPNVDARRTGSEAAVVQMKESLRGLPARSADGRLATREPRPGRGRAAGG